MTVGKIFIMKANNIEPISFLLLFIIVSTIIWHEIAI